MVAYKCCTMGEFNPSDRLALVDAGCTVDLDAVL
jgi:hypothetical protein